MIPTDLAPDEAVALLAERLREGRIDANDALHWCKDGGQPFRWHPLGFVVCTAMTHGNIKVRVHIWPSELSKSQGDFCQIHDHVFRFESWILAGAVKNTEYVIGEQGTEHALYSAEYTGDTSVLKRTDQKFKLHPAHSRIFEAGSYYAVEAGVLHETTRVSRSPALTILITDLVLDHPPRVLIREGGASRYEYVRRILSAHEFDEIFSQF